MDEYNQIIRILETEPLTGDLDFILSTQVIYIDGNFGIPIQSIKQLYTIAFKQFKLNHNKLMNSKLIMLLYPDCYTILNERKSLLLQNQIDKYEEYSFTRFVLTKHSSNSLLWSYRYWIRKQIKIDDTTRQQDDEICNLAAQRYKCNYPCWTFRRLSMLKNSNFELLIQELNKNLLFVKSHVSDSSGWSFREQILWTLKSMTENQVETVQQFLEVLTVEIYDTIQLIQLYPKHETLWNHLYQVISVLNVVDSIKGGEVNLEFLNDLETSTHGHYPYMFSLKLSELCNRVAVVAKSTYTPKFVEYVAHKN